MKKGLIIFSAVVAALITSFISDPGWIEYIALKSGLYSADSERKAIEETVRRFNAYYGMFFSTGGDIRGLGRVPASNLVKRRIVQEINIWSSEGKVLVYDKDKFEVERIGLIKPWLSELIAREVWFLNLQDIQTRKWLTEVKANPIRVRYILIKIDRTWKIIDYEVYKLDEEIPPLFTRKYYKAARTHP